MTKNEFVATAGSLPIQVGSIPLAGLPRKFNSEKGNVGWNFTGKSQLKLPNGEIVAVMVNGNVTVIKSGEWPETSNLALPAPQSGQLVKVA